MDITTIGFDLAKTVFQVHGADGEGRPVLRRKLRRGKVLAFFAGFLKRRMKRYGRPRSIIPSAI